MVDGRQDHVMSRSRKLLCVAMVVMWNQVTEVTASPQPLKSTIFHTLPVSDVTFTQDLLWEKPARSDSDCGGMCVGEAGCSMFSFTPSTDGPGGSCRIHGKRQTPQGQQESAPGVRSYNIVIKDFWIKKACTTSSDCTEPMAACYSGQCLCAGGFFFDYFQNACVSSCTRGLGDTYLQYSNMTLYMYYMYSQTSVLNVTTCHHTCTADPQCTSFNHNHDLDKCNFKYVTAQDYPDSWMNWSGKDYHQRTCN